MASRKNRATRLSKSVSPSRKLPVSKQKNFLLSVKFKKGRITKKAGPHSVVYTSQFEKLQNGYISLQSLLQLAKLATEIVNRISQGELGRGNRR
jgi:hypothetical protein